MGCLVDGCERSLSARGLCRSHYERARRIGVLDSLPRKRISNICKLPGCGKNVYGRGMCKPHWHAEKYLEAKANPQPCKIDGCEKKAIPLQKFCPAHANAQSKRAGAQVCKEPGCTGMVVFLGPARYCKFHYNEESAARAEAVWQRYVAYKAATR